MGERRRVAVLGCGMIGAAMVRDLARDPEIEVLAADASEASLKPLAGLERVTVRRADLSKREEIRSIAGEVEAVAGALPSRFGFAALRELIECGKPFCDISFMAEDAGELDALARSRGVTAVVDFGVAPGLANLAIGRAAAQMDEVDEVVYYVGGLPWRRTLPWQYKAPFAPSDVLEEYTRPARILRDGRPVSLPALSEPEMLEFPETGTLEGFLTDGLRSLLATIPARNMHEKTLRWPGHRDLMQALRDGGFFGKATIDTSTGLLAPLEMTSRLLFPAWKLEPNEPEFTLLVVRASGRQAGEPVSFEYRLFDQRDPETGEHSMARTTGFPCTLMLRALLEKRFATPGVHPPETVGRDEALFRYVLEGLEKRGVRFTGGRT